MAEYYAIVYTYHIFFVHSSISEHLGCFHLLDILSNAEFGGIWREDLQCPLFRQLAPEKVLLDTVQVQSRTPIPYPTGALGRCARPLGTHSPCDVGAMAGGGHLCEWTG